MIMDKSSCVTHTFTPVRGSSPHPAQTLAVAVCPSFGIVRCSNLGLETHHALANQPISSEGPLSG